MGNPATEQTVAGAPEASAEDAGQAAAAARDALPAWSRTSPEHRGRLLQSVADELRKRGEDLLGLVIAETGATLSVGSQLQVPQAVSRFEYYAKRAVRSLDVSLPPTPMPATPLAPGGLIGAVADLDAAVRALVSVWAFHSGQICTAPTRAIVHRPVYDELMARLAAAAPTLKVGPPTDPATVVGPLISAAQRERVERYVELGREEGAEVLAGGSRPEGPGLDKGYYVAPALLGGCTPEMTPVREEIFGPVIVAVPFEDQDEAISIANGSDYGLYDYVFSRDTARAYGVARQLRSGNVGINTAQRNHEAPFGGFKLSGVGRDGGEFGLYAYTELQSIVWPG